MQITPDAPTKVVKIAGHDFTLPEPFTADHLAGASELGNPEILAGVMNQTFHENIRNNFANKVKAAIKADEAPEDGAESVPFDLAALQTELDKYVAEYEFGVRRSGGSSGKTFADPVEQEMYNMAREKVKEALRKKNITLKTIENEKLEELISGVMGKYADALRVNAEKVVAMRNEIASNDIDVSV